MQPPHPQASDFDASALRPNVVFVMLDDVGFADFGAYGGTASTPRVDALAAAGLRFSHYYSLGTVCSPTRASIISGRHPLTFGFQGGVESDSGLGIPPRFPALPQVLRQAGYATWHVGKWHLGEAPGFRPCDKGYTRSIRLLRERRTYFDPDLEIDCRTVERASGHATEVLTNRAIDLIRNHREATPAVPFFLSLWYWAPHAPYDLPDPLPSPCGGNPTTQEERYRAFLCYADHQIGRLIDAIDGLEGLASDCLIVVASDNGGADRAHPTNGPLRGFKGETFDGGIRVPLIARWPGRIDAGAVNDSVIASQDWFPTLATLAGAEVASVELDGEDFSPILAGDNQLKAAPTLYWESEFKAGRAAAAVTSPATSTGETVIRSWGAVRAEPWKLVIEPEAEGGAIAHLFDVADVAEATDLAAAMPAVTRRLVDDYLAWRRRTSRIRYSVRTVRGGARLDGLSRFRFPSPGFIALREEIEFDFLASGEFTCSARVFLGPLGSRSVLAKKAETWRLLLNAAGTAQFKLTEAGGDVLTLESPEPLRQGVWNDVAFTIRRGKGVPATASLVTNGHVVSAPIAGEIRTTNGPLLVGATNELVNNPFLGDIEDFELNLVALYPEQL